MRDGLAIERVGGRGGALVCSSGQCAVQHLRLLGVHTQSFVAEERGDIVDVALHLARVDGRLRASDVENVVCVGDQFGGWGHRDLLHVSGRHVVKRGAEDGALGDALSHGVGARVHPLHTHELLSAGDEVPDPPNRPRVDVALAQSAYDVRVLHGVEPPSISRR